MTVKLRDDEFKERHQNTGRIHPNSSRFAVSAHTDLQVRATCSDWRLHTQFIHILYPKSASLARRSRCRVAHMGLNLNPVIKKNTCVD